MGDNTPRVEIDPDVVRSFLSDAAHVPGGFAAGVVFPHNVDEVVAAVAAAPSILAIGAQSSLTGGATPRGEVVVSTRGLDGITIDTSNGLVRAGAGVPLNTLQSALATKGLWYPPVPTYDGAFVGGTVSTNAAGAATFKYGTTRDWVAGLTVVLADGRVLSLRRGDVAATSDGFKVPVDGQVLRIPLPRYTMPNVPKLSAGYFAKPGMDLVDLFVGSEGTLGVVVEATLRVLPRPSCCVVLLTCGNDEQGFGAARVLRDEAQRSWREGGALDIAAIEYMDARSLALVPEAAFSRAGVQRPIDEHVMLLVQLEVHNDIDAAIDALDQALAATGVRADPLVALPGDEAAAARLFELREAVPAAVNAIIGSAKRDDAEIQKTAGDFIVPFDRLAESVALYRRVFESQGLDYAIWGHVSDGNLHPNVMPHSREQMERGRDALLDAARRVIAMGGSPLAEHGVGRSRLKQQLLGELYGEGGIDDMRAVKRALDPAGKLAPGVLFATTS